MCNQKQLERCQNIIEEILEIEEEAEYLEKLMAGPCGVFSAWPTGMPRGTNSPIMALLQRTDVNEVLDRLEELYAELKLAS